MTPIFKIPSLGNKIGVIGSGSGWGAYRLGTEDGPNHVLSRISASVPLQESLTWVGTAFAPFRGHQKTIQSHWDALDIIKSQHCFLDHLIQKALEKRLFPLVVGGDHAMAVGTWSSITEACHIRENMGLIWIDAHMDAHTLHTTPSFRYHGMPVASLLGYGQAEFVETVSRGAKIHPENMILIGIRSFESGERELLESLNVRIYFMDEVAKRGLPEIFREVRAHLKDRVKHYGISLDLDAFDPLEIPGVGSPAPNGLLTRDFLESMDLLIDPEELVGFEIAEFNPYLDINDQTINFVMEMIHRIISLQKRFGDIS